MALGVSPLDEALGLSAHSPYPPQVLGWLARLGAEVPFARAAFWLEELVGVVVSPATVRRQTEAVGQTAVAVADAEVGQLEQGGRDASPPVPPPAPPPERRVVGADGAMVALRGGEWAEVKLARIGEPVPQGREIRTTQVSYYARLSI